MTVYRRGSKGPEVVRIQEKLKELDLYLGPIDGDFGGGTESAVRRFQKANGLLVDGRVGPQTWQALLGEEIPEPSIYRQPLAYRCLALTGLFETGDLPPECFASLSGDFDGQGLSFGALQWNFGQGSLPPLLLRMRERHPELMAEVFGDHYRIFSEVLSLNRQEQIEWSRSIQDERFRIYQPWRGYFKTLGRLPEFQAIQVEAAAELFRAAGQMAQGFGLWSERAVALMFDIKVQNGGIPPIVEAVIRQDFRELKGLSSDGEELEKMRLIAHRRAEAARPRWVEDVRRRKLTIADGRGIVHGLPVDLARDFGINLVSADLQT
ncbi:peptidoglycan-binding domain-containing protein [Thermosulfuriphilus sp.]